MEEELQYQEEQTNLRREYEGGAKEDIHIEPPKPPEVNPELLKDVEPLLFRGFLYVPATINKVRIIFKSLNHHEFERLLLLADRRERAFHDYFLAYGVLMVEGTSVLSDRDRWLPEIVKTFQEFEESARRKVIWHLSEINRRANRAVLLTEVYALEAMSRLRWAQYQRLDLTSSAVTGFPGTEHLGLNWGQLTWYAINNIEDQREQSEREWENAKFIASAMAGSKGMSQVNSRDRQRREKEQTDRIARRDQVLRTAVLGGGLLAEVASKKGAPMKVARTVEELASQLEKDLKGEKDWHDKVVESYEQRVRDQYQNKLRRLQELRDDHEQQFGSKVIVGGTTFEGLTLDQVKKRVQQRQQTIATKLTQAQESFPEAFDPKLQKFLDKWQSPDDLRELAPPVVSRHKMVPFKRGPQ